MLEPEVELLQVSETCFRSLTLSVLFPLLLVELMSGLVLLCDELELELLVPVTETVWPLCFDQSESLPFRVQVLPVLSVSVQLPLEPRRQPCTVI